MAVGSRAARGGRARHGRQHVDGDYKNPPPPGKYKALHAHARRSLKKPPAEIPPDLREVIALPCLQQFADEEVEVFAILERIRWLWPPEMAPG